MTRPLRPPTSSGQASSGPERQPPVNGDQADELTPAQEAAIRRILLGAQERPLLEASEVAEILGVTERYVWRLGRDGELPRIVFGRHVRYKPAAVDAFIEAHKEGRRPPAARSAPRSSSTRAPRPRTRTRRGQTELPPRF